MPNPADNTMKIVTDRLGRMQHVRTHHHGAAAAARSSFIRQQDILPMKDFFVLFIRSETGVTAIEYGLIAGLISIVIITTASAVGTQIAAVFTAISAILAP